MIWESLKLHLERVNSSGFSPYITLKTFQAVFTLLLSKKHRATETDRQKHNTKKYPFFHTVYFKKHVKIKIYFFGVVLNIDGYLTSCVRTLV